MTGAWELQACTRVKNEMTFCAVLGNVALNEVINEHANNFYDNRSIKYYVSTTFD
jgi:hypothetical protein